MRCMIYFILVMMNHVDLIMHPRGQIIKSYKLDIIGQAEIEMISNILHIVMNSKEWGSQQRGMK
jgi:hypothetical protein